VDRSDSSARQVLDTRGRNRAGTRVGARLAALRNMKSAVRIAAVFAAALAVAGGGRAAFADDDTDASVSADSEPRTAIGLHAGIGTASGIITVAREWRVSSKLSVQAGVGLGLGGFQAKILPQLELQLSKHGWLTVGAGASGGQYRWHEQGGFCFQDSCATKSTNLALWGITKIGIQYRWSSGWRFGPYVGGAVLANPSSLECTGADEALVHCERDHVDDGQKRLFTGFSLVRAF
jgi:hypothetical protein